MEALREQLGESRAQVQELEAALREQTALAAQRGGCGHHGGGNVRIGDEGLSR